MGARERRLPYSRAQVTIAGSALAASFSAQQLRWTDSAGTNLRKVNEILQLPFAVYCMEPSVNTEFSSKVLSLLCRQKVLLIAFSIHGLREAFQDDISHGCPSSVQPPSPCNTSPFSLCSFLQMDHNKLEDTRLVSLKTATVQKDKHLSNGWMSQGMTHLRPCLVPPLLL